MWHERCFKERDMPFWTLVMPCLNCGGRQAIDRAGEFHCVKCREPLTGDQRPVSLIFCCPECGMKDFRMLQDLGRHIERHRPMVDAAPPMSGRGKRRLCPMKCGRVFWRLQNYTEHIPMCDGSEPIPILPQRRATVGA